MLVIGLTGGIASGKSTVSAYLRELNAPVVDADAIVREVQQPGSSVLAAIREKFGSEVILPDGSLDRPALGRIIFSDPERRRHLESIVHPAVRERMWAEVERYRREGHPAVVLDIPLLLEGGLDRTVDQVWLVYVDRETQLARLIARDGLSAEEAAQRMAAQMDLELKRSRSHVIIDNRGTLDATREQVARAWQAALEVGRSS